MALNLIYECAFFAIKCVCILGAGSLKKAMYSAKKAHYLDDFYFSGCLCGLKYADTNDVRKKLWQ